MRVQRFREGGHSALVLQPSVPPGPLPSLPLSCVFSRVVERVVWPRWGRGRTCCSPMFAVPAIARQSLISEPPSRRRLVGSSYRRSTTRAATWPQQAPPSPFAAGGRTTSRHGATPARALACPSACATGAHAVRTVPKPVLRAGGRVVATAPAPSSARGSSAIVIAGCTILGKLPLRLHISKSARVPSADRVVLSYR